MRLTEGWQGLFWYFLRTCLFCRRKVFQSYEWIGWMVWVWKSLCGVILRALVLKMDFPFCPINGRLRVMITGETFHI